MACAMFLFALALSLRAQALVSTTVIDLNISGTVFATDSQGNLYLAGITNRSGLPASPRALQTDHAGGTCFASGTGLGGLFSLPCYDIFVAKLDPARKQILAATYLGGTSSESVSGIAVGEDGGVYISGTSDSAGFLPGSAPSETTGFAAQLTAGLDRILYSMRVPAARMAVDRLGNAWVSGTLSRSNAVLTRIGPSGELGPSTIIEGMDLAAPIAVDIDGNPVVVGKGGAGVMVARFNTLGERVRTDSFGDYQYTAVAAGTTSGDVYMGGYVAGNWYSPGTPGGFFAQVRPDGTVHTIRVGQEITAVAVTREGRAFASGRGSAGLQTTVKAVRRCRVGDRLNSIVIGWDGASAKLSYATYLGPSGPDSSSGITVDSSGVVTIARAIPEVGSLITQIRPDVEAG